MIRVRSFLRYLIVHANVLCVLLFFLAGCVTVRKNKANGNYSLNSKEKHQAIALANFLQSMLYTNNSDKAIERLEKSIVQDPDRGRLNTMLASEYLKRQENEKAILELQKACEKDPKDFHTHIEFAVACQVTGDIKEAIKQYYIVTKLIPANTYVYIALANLLFIEKKDDEAIKLLKRSLKVAYAPHAIVSFCFNRGRDFINKGEIERSLKCFRLIATTTNGDKRSLYLDQLALLYKSRGFDQAAIEVYNIAINSENPQPGSFVNLADIIGKTNHKKAIKILMKGNKAIPDNPAILFALAYNYDIIDESKKAIEYYQACKEILIERKVELSEDFYLCQGSAYERAGLFEDAVNVFEECLDHYPESHQVLNYLAYMFAEKGLSLDKAKRYVTKALKLVPDNGAYIDTLGWIYFKQGKYNLALKEIQKALSLEKDDPTITEHLGDIYFSLKKKDMAMEAWAKSLQIDPDNKELEKKIKEHGGNIRKLMKALRKEPTQQMSGEDKE